MMKETRSTLSENTENVLAAEQGLTFGRMTFRVILYFLAFILIRTCAEWLLVIITMALAHMFPSALKDVLLITADGGFVDFTGNCRACITGISYAVCGVFFFGAARGFSFKYTEVKDRRPQIYALLCLISVLFAVFLNILIVKTGIPDISGSYREVAKDQYSCSLLMGLIVYGLISPSSEEVIFRGVIYNRIKGWLGRKAALLIVSLLFAVYHGNVAQGLYAFFMSLLIVFAYERCGSLVVPILMHSSANIAAYILTYLFKNAAEGLENNIMIVSGMLAALLFVLFIITGNKDPKKIIGKK